LYLHFNLFPTYRRDDCELKNDPPQKKHDEAFNTQAWYS